MSRWREGSWRGRAALFCAAEDCRFITTDRLTMVKHAREHHPVRSDPAPRAHPLAGVPFETERAMELAASHKLGKEAFADVEPTGKRAGGYTVADVRLAAQAMNRKEK